MAIDSDRTLFHTHNGTQSVLATALAASATVIEIVPVPANDAEVWPDNGFASLPNELLYYDSVVRNNGGKVERLVDCVRAVEGVAEDLPGGTPIYGNAVAQHHNQLAEAILELERTVGDLFNTVHQATRPVGLVADVDAQFTRSLQASLQSLSALTLVPDDACPDVEFVFVAGTAPAELGGGVQADFCVRIQGWDPATMTYLLDFGDGTSTTTEFAGQHTYASGATVNPVVTVVAPNCTLVVTPTTPQDGCEITQPVPPVAYYVPIPDVPAFPSFIAPRPICPGPLFNLPPIFLNCEQTLSAAPSVSGISAECCSMPSVISVVGCNMPSLISVECCNFPSQISVVGLLEIPSAISVTAEFPSLIAFASCCHIPSVITFEGCDFGAISTGCISFCDPPSFSPISWLPPPMVSVDWGTPPPVTVSIVCFTSSFTSSTGGGGGGGGFAMRARAPGQEDDFDEDAGIPLNIMNDLGIPSEIKIIAPDKIKVDRIPDIKILGPDKPLPQTIRIVGHLPETIRLEAFDLPSRILVEPADNFPRTIHLEAVGIPDTLRVVGIPEAIEVIGNIPSTIQLVMPDNPVVELVYRGGAIPIELPLQKTLGDEGGPADVAVVPAK